MVPLIWGFLGICEWIKQTQTSEGLHTDMHFFVIQSKYIYKYR